MNSAFLFFEGLAKPPARREPRQPLAARVPSALPATEASELLLEVMRRAELPPESYNSRALQRRLPACLRFLRVDSTAEARRRLAEEPGLAEAVLDIVLLGVTDFFRDRPVFELLRTRVLPDLSRRPGPLRVWSAACSEGQELYSVAMLIAAAGRLSHAELLGTDCRPEAIARARMGCFGAGALDELQPPWREEFFVTQRGIWAVKPAIREAVRWKTADLLAGAEAGPWELILWRNMAIYLTPHAAGLVWRDLVDVLAPGGYLITGKAEQPPRGLSLVRVAPCVYQKIS